jgi:hypothetical protein
MEGEKNMRKVFFVIALLAILGLALSMFGQQAAPVPKDKPKVAQLLFREDFKAGAEHEVQLTQDLLTNPNLELKKYGPGAKLGNKDQSGLLISNELDPATGKMQTLIWTGVVQAPWAVMLRDKNNVMDLRDTGKVHWRIRPRQFHELRLLIKLTDGTLLAADYAEPGSTYSRENEIFLSDVPRWRTLSPETMAEAKPKPGAGIWTYDVDLSKVDEIGFSDLQAGAGHGALGGNTAVDWIEVYGQALKRGVVNSSQVR